MVTPMVVDDLDEAAVLIGRGVDVVVIVAPEEPHVDVGTRGPGRLALLVGDAANDEVRRAAVAMDMELFGWRTGAEHTIP